MRVAKTAVKDVHVHRSEDIFRGSISYMSYSLNSLTGTIRGFYREKCRGGLYGGYQDCRGSLASGSHKKTVYRQLCNP